MCVVVVVVVVVAVEQIAVYLISLTLSPRSSSLPADLKIEKSYTEIITSRAGA